MERLVGRPAPRRPTSPSNIAKQMVRDCGVLIQEGIARRGLYLDPGGIVKDQVVNRNEVGRSVDRTDTTTKTERGRSMRPRFATLAAVRHGLCTEAASAFTATAYLAGEERVSPRRQEFGLAGKNKVNNRILTQSGGKTMSFCCGASMIGMKGTLKHYRTRIHNVPILFCPVCHRVEVHYLVENEYEILAEYAHGDGAAEIDFSDYVDESDKALHENCVNHDDEDDLQIVQNQIDMALDLLSFAKSIRDEEWEAQLKIRLAVLSKRRHKLLMKRATGGTH